MNRLPRWVSRDKLSGGFHGEPLAGGPELPWEKEMFVRHGLESREQANLFFITEEGRGHLRRLLRSRRYRISVPEEGALLLLSQRPLEEAAPLRPFFATLRFYPMETGTAASLPPLKTAHRQTVAELIDSLRRYRLPLEIRRKREALTRWRPLYESLLEAVAETREEEWPFQRYPEGWAERQAGLLSQLESALEKEPICHYPQRAESNLRHMALVLRKAVSRPATLTGREVGLARAILNASEEKRGPLGTGRRAQQPALPGFSPEEVIPPLLDSLRRLDPDSGIASLQPLRPDELPAPIRRKLEAALQAEPEELHRRGLLPSVEVLAELAPQISAGFMARAAPSPDTALLVFRSYLTRQGREWEYPWLSLPDPGGEAARYLLETLWTYFPWAPCPPALMEELKTKSLEEAGEILEPRIDFEKAAAACLDHAREQEERRVERPYLRLQRDRRAAYARRMAAYFKAASVASSAGPRGRSASAGRELATPPSPSGGLRR